jgi:hypothetical protein
VNDRPYVWNADRRSCYTSAFPWRVTIGDPEHINDFLSSFATFGEALEYANGYASGDIK